uniref:SPOR domain-containing protein n=1 Tax=Pseudomonas aeruginosa TaxID=287 RepID=UPI003D2A5502
MAKKKPAPKRGASRYQAPAAKNGVPGWVWLVAGLAIGGFIMFLMKLEPGRKDVQRERPDAQRPAAVQGKQPQQNGQAQQPAQTQTPAQAKPKYEFYTLLPESEVVVPPEAVPEKAPPPPTPAERAKAGEARAMAALGGQVPPPLPQAVLAAS